MQRWLQEKLSISTLGRNSLRALRFRPFYLLSRLHNPLPSLIATAFVSLRYGMTSGCAARGVPRRRNDKRKRRVGLKSGVCTSMKALNCNYESLKGILDK